MLHTCVYDGSIKTIIYFKHRTFNIFVAVFYCNLHDNKGFPNNVLLFFGFFFKRKTVLLFYSLFFSLIRVFRFWRFFLLFSIVRVFRYQRKTLFLFYGVLSLIRSSVSNKRPYCFLLLYHYSFCDLRVLYYKKLPICTRFSGLIGHIVITRDQ